MNRYEYYDNLKENVDELYHSTGPWKKHKYIGTKIVNGIKQYIYKDSGNSSQPPLSDDGQMQNYMDRSGRTTRMLNSRYEKMAEQEKKRQRNAAYQKAAQRSAANDYSDEATQGRIDERNRKRNATTNMLNNRYTQMANRERQKMSTNSSFNKYYDMAGNNKSARTTNMLNGQYEKLIARGGNYNFGRSSILPNKFVVRDKVNKTKKAVTNAVNSVTGTAKKLATSAYERKKAAKKAGNKVKVTANSIYSAAKSAAKNAYNVGKAATKAAIAQAKKNKK